MDKVGGPLGLAAIVVVVAVVALLAVLHFGFHVFRRRKGKSRAKPGIAASHVAVSGVTSDSRVEVLETTVIDSERRLVLIRCDKIEHLIMIGGPADLVVENDVRKVRSPGAPPSKIPGIEPEKRAPLPPRPAPPAAITAVETALTPVPKSPDPVRPAPRPIIDARPTATPGRSLPPLQPTVAPVRTAARNGGDAPNAPPVRAEEIRPAAQRPQPVDSKAGRREPVPPRRPQTAPPTPVGRANEPLRPTPIAPASDRNARPPAKPATRVEPVPALPAAQVPWTEPDSIENEIVRALRFEPNTRTDQASGRRAAPAGKAAVDSTTTLGDLADKLEEALAREVQSAGQPQQATPDVQDFGFQSEPAPAESERPKPAIQKPAAQKERLEQKDRQEKRPEPARAAKPAPAQEAESRPETPAQPERREEAPVISLSSRRRESADQLEDEMARLLGELTSDTKGR